MVRDRRACTRRPYGIFTHKAGIPTAPLRRPADTPGVIVQFLTGLIVGVLIGLAIAPVLQSWLVWQEARRWDDRDRDRDRERPEFETNDR